MKHFSGSLLASVLAFSLLAVTDCQAQILRRAVDVLALDGGQGRGSAQPVEIHGVVIGVSTMFNFFAVNDGTGTVGVLARRAHGVKQGDLVNVTGTTSLNALEGRLRPRVVMDSVEVLGSSELPVPKAINVKSFTMEENFDQWVSLEGYVMRWQYKAPDLQVSLAAPEGSVDANVTVPDASLLPKLFHGARVRLTGMIVSTAALGRVLFVPDLKQLEILAVGTEDLFDAPLASIQDVRQRKVAAGQRWRVQGVFVARTQDSKVIVVGEGGAMMNGLLPQRGEREPGTIDSEAESWPELKPGDRVEMVGSIMQSADRESRAEGLTACSLRVTAQGEPPVPESVDLKTIRDDQNEQRWVSLEGVVTAWRLQDERLTYAVITPQGQIFVEVWDVRPGAFPVGLHGARVRFTGITRRVLETGHDMLIVPDVSHVEVIAQGQSDPFAVAEVSVADIVAGRASQAARLRVRGVVIGRPKGGEVYLRGQEGALRVTLQQPWLRPVDDSGALLADGGTWPALSIGDEVELVGSLAQPLAGPLQPGSDLYEGVVRVLRQVGVPSPVETTLGKVVTGAHGSDWVQLRGRLLTLQRVPMDRGQWRTTMLLEEEGLKLPVTLQRTGRPSFNTLQTDDEVLVRALVNRATPTEPRHLWLLSEGDVKSLGLAPAVRARQLWWWVGSGAVVFTFLLGWVVVLRRAGRIQREAAAELKVAVQAARDSERRWKLLFEESPLSVQIFQPDGQTKQFNHAWKQLFRMDEAAGYEFNVLKAPDLIASGAVDHIRKAFEGEVVHVPPVPYVPKIDPSDVRWIGAVLYPLKNEAGQVMEVVTIHSDITEAKRVEDAMLAMNHTLEQRVNERTQELKLAQTDLIRALEQERELNELKSRFVTMVSHEFRTPLGIIMSAIELIRHYEDRLPPEQRRELCDDIFGATRLMAALMEQVLVLGRVEAGKLGCRVQPLDVETLVGKLTDESLSATHRKCQVEWCALNSLAGAAADEALLRHIFANLVTNAVKYSPEGSLVRFTAQREGRDCVFQIIDRGIGIPTEDRARLFEAFYRCGNVGDIPGTGLGLLIVKRCVDLHGGSLEVESEVGKGTTFTVRIPMFETGEAK